MQRKHEAARRLYEAEAQVTTQSAELLRRSEAEVARLRKQASEHTARVEKAQLRMQDMREQLGSAQVGGGGENRVQGLLGSGADMHARRAGAARWRAGPGGEGTGCRALGRAQGRVGHLGAAGQEDGHMGGSAGACSAGVSAKRACWQDVAHMCTWQREAPSHGGQCQHAGRAGTDQSLWTQALLLCYAVRCPVRSARQLVRPAALCLEDQEEGDTPTRHDKGSELQIGDAVASLSLRSHPTPPQVEPRP